MEDNLEVISLQQGPDKRFMTFILNKNVNPHFFKQSDKIIIKNLMCLGFCSEIKQIVRKHANTF